MLARTRPLTPIVALIYLCAPISAQEKPRVAILSFEV